MKQQPDEKDTGSIELVRLVGRGSLGSLAVKIAHVTLGLGVTVILARVLGPQAYGVYSWSFALVVLLAIPARMGFTQLLVRETAAYQLQQEWGLLRGLLLRANQAVVATSVVLAAVAGTILWRLGDRLESAEILTFGWALLLLPLMALGDLRGAALRGLRHVVMGQLPESVLRPAFLIVLAGAGAALIEMNAPAAMALHAVAAGMAFAIGAVLLLRWLPGEVRSAESRFETRRWLSSIVPFSLIAGMQVINSQTDIVLLGFFVPSEDVGFYTVAAKGATLVPFTLSAVNMVIAPYISRLHAKARADTLQDVLTWTARVILLTALPVAAILILFGNPILGFIFGPEYAAGYVALVILCVGQVINAGAGSVGMLLTMTGHERDAAFGVSIAAGLNVVLNLLLIPQFGMAGAAVATAASLLTWNLLLCLRAYRHLGLVTTAVDWSARSRER